MSLLRILGIWAMLAGLMIFNGALRVVISPFVGKEAAEMMSLFLGLIIIVGASRPFLIEIPAQPARRIWMVSLAWVFLTVAFEVLLGVAFGQSVSDAWGAYVADPFWPVILLAVGVAPFQWIKRSRVSVAGVFAGSRSRQDRGK